MPGRVVCTREPSTEDEEWDTTGNPIRSPGVGGHLVTRKPHQPAGRSWATCLTMLIMALVAAAYLVPILILMLDR